MGGQKAGPWGLSQTLFTLPIRLEFGRESAAEFCELSTAANVHRRSGGYEHRRVTGMGCRWDTGCSAGALLDQPLGPWLSEVKCTSKHGSTG